MGFSSSAMEGFALAAISSVPTSTAAPRSAVSFLSTRIFFTNRRRVVARSLRRYRKPGKFSVFASKDEPRLDEWDQMELKFGKMLGEDPKLTMAKIIGRKGNPDASYLDIEKSFHKRKGKAVDVEEVQFEGSKGQSSGSLEGLSLVRPVPKKGVKSQADGNQSVPSGVKKPIQSVGSSARSNVPNVILRKPAIVNEDDVEDKLSKLRIKRNLSLSMRREPMKEKYSDMTLLRKPEPMSVADSEKPEVASENKSESDESVEIGSEEYLQTVYNDFTLMQKPSATDGLSRHVDTDASESTDVPNLRSEANDEHLQHNPRDVEIDYSIKFSAEASLLKRPERLGEPLKGILYNEMGATEAVSDNALNNFVEDSLPTASELVESEEADWTRAEDLVKTGGRGDVEFVSSSTRGFVVSFGSLIGFLPYRNLAAKWKFLAFESWLRQKGLDPSKYKQNLGVLGTSEAAEKSNPVDGGQSQIVDGDTAEEISPDMQLEDLLRIYDQEKLKFLSSFIGQKIKANVLVADRKFRKLIFSMRPKEKEEQIEKKRSLMAKLRVGDVVKCYIKKIAYFGIFVEVEGVPALIHQTEVSWDATLDPMAFFKLGQIVEAKVHQLDFALERIFLSLKEITPDPLIEALESVVGDHIPLDGRLEAAEIDTEWAEVESLIKELEQIEGVQNVTKGRFFLSPGLAPTFQVYMASMFENEYKLLARAGNKVQEVIVEASLDKEKMKSVILTCTNRVE